MLSKAFLGGLPIFHLKQSRYSVPPLNPGLRMGARPTALQLPGVLVYRDTPSWPSRVVAARPHSPGPVEQVHGVVWPLLRAAGARLRACARACVDTLQYESNTRYITIRI